MKNSNRILFFTVLLFAITAGATAQQRELLKGKVITDSVSVSYLTVQNLTTGRATVTDAEAVFTISAHAGDTLFFSGMPIRDLKLVLKKADFKEALFVVRADVNVIMLDEVVVHNLTGNLAVDSKRSNIAVYKPEFDTRQINKDIISGGGAANGSMNFIAIYKMVAKNKSKIPDTKPYVSDKPFTVKVRELYEDEFFVKTLKIEKEDIPIFLQYCAPQGSDWLLNPKNELQLITYLTDKSSAFLKEKTFRQD
ncbi:hypothetical protein [Flavobacterium rhizosphaerae]|uniref:DUF4369 domain-containing protein n=1 Tax=Flavobacterium rhizosphaerae TaxID=3163298 RepID=A0ABW8YZS8_9FLAO